MTDAPPPPPRLRALYDAEATAPAGGDRDAIRARLAATLGVTLAATATTSTATATTATATATTGVSSSVLGAGGKLAAIVLAVGVTGAGIGWSLRGDRPHSAAQLDTPVKITNNPIESIEPIDPSSIEPIDPSSIEPIDPSSIAPIDPSSIEPIDPSPIATATVATATIATAPPARIATSRTETSRTAHARSTRARPTGSARIATPSSPAAPPSAATLAPSSTTHAPDHAALVRRAWDARRRGDATAVLALVDDDARFHPGGVLAEEREALRIDALLHLGRADQARRHARAFVARHPASLHRALVAPALQELP